MNGNVTVRATMLLRAVSRLPSAIGPPTPPIKHLLDSAPRFSKMSAMKARPILAGS